MFTFLLEFFPWQFGEIWDGEDLRLIKLFCLIFFIYFPIDSFQMIFLFFPFLSFCILHYRVQFMGHWVSKCLEVSSMAKCCKKQVSCDTNWDALDFQDTSVCLNKEILC